MGSFWATMTLLTASALLKNNDFQTQQKRKVYSAGLAIPLHSPLLYQPLTYSCQLLCWAIATGCKNTNFSKETHQPGPREKKQKQSGIYTKRQKERKKEKRKKMQGANKKERKKALLAAGIWSVYTHACRPFQCCNLDWRQLRTPAGCCFCGH